MSQRAVDALKPAAVDKLRIRDEFLPEKTTVELEVVFGAFVDVIFCPPPREDIVRPVPQYTVVVPCGAVLPDFL